MPVSELYNNMGIYLMLITLFISIRFRVYIANKEDKGKNLAWNITTLDII